jgi:hypothetical protein
MEKSFVDPYGAAGLVQKLQKKPAISRCLPIPPEKIQAYNKADKRQQAESDHESDLEFQGGKVNKQRFVVDKITDTEGDAVGKKRLHHVGAARQRHHETVQKRPDNDPHDNGDDKR